MISRGCTKNCSYCAIKKAIGPLISKPLDQCVKEFKKGLSLGYKDFVITADDVGAYGLDINSSFPKLLGKITSVEGDYNIEIQGLHPVWIVKYIDELEGILKRRKIKIIICPIQSGSSRLLKLMHRYHNTEKMKEVFLRIKKSFPDLSLETNYLVGFPTETDEDVEETLSFIKQVNFDACYVFPFSCKTGTMAEKIEPKIQKQEIFKRLEYVKEYFKNTDIPVHVIK